MKRILFILSWMVAMPLAQADADPQLETLTAEVVRLQEELNQQRQATERWEHIYQQEKYIRRGHTLREHLDNPWDISLVWSLVDVALIYANEGRWGDAEQLARRALAIIEATWGTEHPARGTVLQHVANFRFNQSDTQTADYLYREAIHVFEKALGERHPRHAAALNARASILQSANRLNEAEALYRKSITIYEASPRGGAASDVAAPLHNLALLLMAREQYDEAESLLRRAARAQQRRPAAPLDQQALVQRSLARLYLRQDELELAIRHEAQANALEMRTVRK